MFLVFSKRIFNVSFAVMFVGILMRKLLIYGGFFMVLAIVSYIAVSIALARNIF